MHRTKVRIVEDALDANNTIARANREDFDRAGVSVVNLMSAPGAGKTALLERALTGLADDGVRVGVLEGDVQGSFDADRLADLHIPVTQLNTDNGFGGECHLDANMVRTALGELPLAELDLLIIENVGNLVCPAEFHVGADARIMICSVTEGEDKPLKYPLMFRACELVVVNKIDLLPHLDYDVDRLEANIAQVNPDTSTMRVSARTGEGVDAFRQWLIEVPARNRAAARQVRIVRSLRPVAGAGLRLRWPSAPPSTPDEGQIVALPAGYADPSGRCILAELMYWSGLIAYSRNVPISVTPNLRWSASDASLGSAMPRARRVSRISQGRARAWRSGTRNHGLRPCVSRAARRRR
jgi:hydrogenase nickel incorporation protein HypB